MQVQAKIADQLKAYKINFVPPSFKWVEVEPTVFLQVEIYVNDPKHGGQRMPEKQPTRGHGEKVRGVNYTTYVLWTLLCCASPQTDRSLALR